MLLGERGMVPYTAAAATPAETRGAGQQCGVTESAGQHTALQRDATPPSLPYKCGNTAATTAPVWLRTQHTVCLALTSRVLGHRLGQHLRGPGLPVTAAAATIYITASSSSCCRCCYCFRLIVMEGVFIPIISVPAVILVHPSTQSDISQCGSLCSCCAHTKSCCSNQAVVIF